MSIVQHRTRAIRETMTRIRAAGIHEGDNTPQAIDAASAALCDLAARRDLFPEDQFPFLYERRSGFYRLSEDADQRNALYVQVSRNGIGNQPHRHPHWAIIVGVQGNELNRLYERTDDGSVPFRGRLRSIGDVAITPGVALHIPEERYHTIEIAGAEAGIHLHFYAVAADSGAHRGVPRFLSPDSEDYIVREDASHEIGVQRIGAADIAAAEDGGEDFSILDLDGRGFPGVDPARILPGPKTDDPIHSLPEEPSTPLVLLGGGDAVRALASRLVRLGYGNSFWFDPGGRDPVAARETA